MIDLSQFSTHRLDALPLLEGLNEQERAALLALTTHRHIPRGTPLISQGEDADHVYYVLRGKFEVLRDGRLVAEIGAGEPVGEIAFFAGSNRTADVVAARDSEVIEVGREAWRRISMTLPTFGDSVLRALSRRLAAATATAAVLAPKIPDTIAFCPAGQAPIPEALIQALAQTAGPKGRRLRLIRASDAPDTLDPLRPGAFASWLGSLEAPEQQVLLITGQGPEAWDQAALRQSDHLILCGALAEGQAAPVPLGRLEAFANPLFRLRQVRLVLWRPSGAEPIAMTRNWLSGRRVHLHHHLALDLPEDTARLHRFLTGRAVGAVFGGGGAWGAGHIGAVRALYAAGLEFDIAGGTSIGSCVASAMAAMQSPAEMLERFEHILHKRKALGKMVLPRFGLFDAHHTDAILDEAFGDQRLEDQPLSAYAVAANISTNELQVIREGRIATAIRASASIPGALMPYVTEDGEVLVDGGIMNNVPLDVMRGLKMGPNIVFAFSSGEDWRIKSRYSEMPSRWQILWQTLTFQRPTDDLPRFADVVGRAMQVTSSRTFRHAGLGQDQLLELPGVKGMSILGFKLARAQEALGYDYTSRLIEGMGGPEGLMAWKEDWTA